MSVHVDVAHRRSTLGTGCTCILLLLSPRLVHESAPQGELDELEREEFFRLKKVQKSKHAKQKIAVRPLALSSHRAVCPTLAR